MLRLAMRKKAVTLSPSSSPPWEILARALQTLGRLEEAIQAFDQAIAACPETSPLTTTRPSLALQRAKLLQQLHGPKAALAEFEALTTHYPDSFKVHAALAAAQVEDKQFSLAIQSAQQALQASDAGEDPLELANVHYLIGRLLRQAGQLDQAIHHLIQAVQINPTFLDAQLELGFVRKERREYHQALQAFQQAALIAPQDARPPYQAGLALKEGKDYRQAEALLRRAASLSPDDVNIRRQLAAVVALNLIHNPRAEHTWTE
jgi:tetratricopeptide (TPR) repeat protein